MALEQPVARQGRELPPGGDVAGKARLAQRLAHRQLQDGRAAVGQREPHHGGRALGERRHGVRELDGVVHVVSLGGEARLLQRGGQIREPQVLVVLQPAPDQRDTIA